MNSDITKPFAWHNGAYLHSTVYFTLWTHASPKSIIQMRDTSFWKVTDRRWLWGYELHLLEQETSEKKQGGVTWVLQAEDRTFWQCCLYKTGNSSYTENLAFALENEMMFLKHCVVIFCLKGRTSYFDAEIITIREWSHKGLSLVSRWSCWLSLLAPVSSNKLGLTGTECMWSSNRRTVCVFTLVSENFPFHHL